MWFQTGDAVDGLGVFRLSVEVPDGAAEPERLGGIGEVQVGGHGDGQDDTVLSASDQPG